MFLATQGQAFFMWNNVFIRLVSLSARGAVMSLIFLKSVRLSNAAREKMAIG
eukprot:COSAG04_NODE_25406_length_308_cov_0.727273_1_plen_51_part_10